MSLVVQHSGGGLSEIVAPKIKGDELLYYYYNPWCTPYTGNSTMTSAGRQMIDDAEKRFLAAK